MNYILANSLSIIATLVAAFLAYEGVGYWGWFLLLAFVAGHLFTSVECDCKKEK